MYMLLLNYYLSYFLAEKVFDCKVYALIPSILLECVWFSFCRTFSAAQSDIPGVNTLWVTSGYGCVHPCSNEAHLRGKPTVVRFRQTVLCLCWGVAKTKTQEKKAKTTKGRRQTDNTRADLQRQQRVSFSANICEWAVCRSTDCSFKSVTLTSVTQFNTVIH